jgi:AraC-like DNA-binding protein
MNNEDSAAIKIYLGAGPTGGYQPIDQQERMKQAFPNDHEQKLTRIKKYLEEDHPPDTWSSSDLVQEQKAFEALLAKKFPELDSVAVNSLACCWSYQWR